MHTRTKPLSIIIVVVAIAASLALAAMGWGSALGVPALLGAALATAGVAALNGHSAGRVLAGALVATAAAAAFDLGVSRVFGAAYPELGVFRGGLMYAALFPAALGALALWDHPRD